MSDLSPMLSKYLEKELSEITGMEPRLSTSADMRGMGKTQWAFLRFLREKWLSGDVKLLDAWRFLHEYSGNDQCSRKKEDLYRSFTSALLGRMVHSFCRRNLIEIVQHDGDQFGWIRPAPISAGQKVETHE